MLPDVLLLAMLGLLAIVTSDWLHLTGNARVLCGALVAVSSDRPIRLVRDRFLKSADSHMSHLLPETQREAIMTVPAGDGEPETIRVQVLAGDSGAGRIGPTFATISAGGIGATSSTITSRRCGNWIAEATRRAKLGG